ncbi:hypothetical protein ACOI1C_12810 [Bacillus sp. DJP31]|uniref:hypothetical protein n=1 Tax=Bacillus sp. DJP31 TaxID=3409789 RepID=UPI003BB50D34
MDKTPLVERDFKDGELLIKHLDMESINVHSAFWLYDSEMENWRLIIASKIAEFVSPRRAYINIRDVLRKLEMAVGYKFYFGKHISY